MGRKIVYGRPRHPQSQGLVEQANETMENMIGAAMEQYNTKEWAKLLPKIAYNLNTSKSSTMKFMPFEIVFNKKPNFGDKKTAFDCDKDGNELPCDIAGVLTPPETPNENEVEERMEEEKNNEEKESDDEESEEEIEEETQVRKELRKNKAKNVEKMIKKHDHKRNKKTREFKVGENVSVKIPKIDRGGHNFSRISGKVCKISSHKEAWYHVLTIYGILADRYRASDLEPFSGIVQVNLENYENSYKEISLREAAQLQGANRGSVEKANVTCNCVGVCYNDGRCKWKKIFTAVHLNPMKKYLVYFINHVFYI